MNESEHVGGGADPIGVDTRLPLSCEALYLADQQAFHDYAYVLLGDDAAAEGAVHLGMLQVRDHWDELLVESNMQQQVWAIVRGAVEDYRREREERAAIAKGLDDYRQGLFRLNGEQGVFEALASLPPQQFDAVVLRYILGYTPQRIGWYMGITESTVSHHCQKGKQRIEQAVPSLIKKSGDGAAGDGKEKGAEE
jgi:RNA polymerase sigma-70 factor (ECF subfamily)